MAVAARAVGRTGAEILFPPKGSQPKGRQARDDATPKAKQIAIRPPPVLEEYINDIVRHGYSKTEIALRLMFTSKDAVEELGSEWWEVEARAHREGISPGKALALFARAGIQAANKKK